MENNTINMFTPVTEQRPNYIKVIGVGGGGGNAVNYMFTQGIEGVDFVLCNTDSQALNKSGITTKVHLGQHDLGAGNNPDFGREAAESKVSIDELNSIINPDITKMVFITAGMGGGTGTGAAPVVAKIAKGKGILTVGIVTIPFECEGRRRKMQAERGIKELAENVDALIVISNDKLRQAYGNMILTDAFHKADEVLLTAAKGIAEIITVPGYINVDFRDVDTVMRDSGKAIMGMGIAKGENRATEALDMALSSPLLNDNDINGAKNLLIRITSAPGENEIKLDEATHIIETAQDRCGNVSDVIWGNGYDESLGDSISITVIATGFGNTDNSPKITTHELRTEQAAETAIIPPVTTCHTEKRVHNLLEPCQPQAAPQVENRKAEIEEMFPEIRKIEASTTQYAENTQHAPIVNVDTYAEPIATDNAETPAIETANVEDVIHETPCQQPIMFDAVTTDNGMAVQDTNQQAESEPKPIIHTLDSNPAEAEAITEAETEAAKQEEPAQSTLIHNLADLFGTDDDTPTSTYTRPAESNTSPSWDNGGQRSGSQQPIVKKYDNMFGSNDSDNDFEITSRLSSNTQAATIEKIEVEVEKATIVTQPENKIDPRVEQRNKLRSLSQFNFNNDQELSMLENVPAYMRRNKNIEANNGNDDEMSRYSGSAEGTYSKNPYLHDNID